MHAIQVADNPFASERKMLKLMDKTRFILNIMDSSFIAEDYERSVVWRDEFLAGGYARVDEATATAVKLAKDQLDLSLETTYTGKAMAAMLHDIETTDYDGARCLFWNTYNARPVPVNPEKPARLGSIPVDFERYFEAELN